MNRNHQVFRIIYKGISCVAYKSCWIVATRTQSSTYRTNGISVFSPHLSQHRPSSMYLYIECRKTQHLTASLSTSWWKVQFDVYGVKTWVEIVVVQWWYFYFWIYCIFIARRIKTGWCGYGLWMCFVVNRWDWVWLRIWAETNISATGHCIVIEFNVMYNDRFRWILCLLIMP